MMADGGAVGPVVGVVLDFEFVGDSEGGDEVSFIV